LRGEITDVFKLVDEEKGGPDDRKRGSSRGSESGLLPLSAQSRITKKGRSVLGKDSLQSRRGRVGERRTRLGEGKNSPPGEKGEKKLVAGDKNGFE